MLEDGEHDPKLADVSLSISSPTSPLHSAPALTERQSVSVIDTTNARRIYANNAPKILLETITARTALLIIMLTYVIFFIGFGLDFQTIYHSFNSNTYVMDGYRCTSMHNISSSHHYGCSGGINGTSWNSTVTSLTNVISINLNVQQNNLSTIIPNVATFKEEVSITFDIHLWACFDKHGCGNSYQHGDGYTTNAHVWQKVVSLTNQLAKIDFSTDLKYSLMDGYYISYELLENTFQNQESIPTNGLVKAYHMTVDYVDNPYNLFLTNTPQAEEDVTYTFEVIARSQQPIVDVLTIIMIFCTLALLIKYVTVMRRQSYILPEQRWLIVYLILVILFQNPIYVVIDWYKSAPAAPGIAYASYVLNYLGQSGLFVLWLFFADSINRKSKHVLMFYLPKIFVGLAIFVCGIVILTIQFPGLDPSGARRDSVEAVVNWSPNLRTKFIVFTFLYLLLTMLWAIGWGIRLFLTGRALKRIPYMSTRYIQLSYRFFSIQATLVTFYYVFQYAAVLYFISRGTSAEVYDSVSITDEINTLFRQETQLFGKTLFLSVYGLILAFLFLPASYWETTSNKTLTASLASTFVITEEERDAMVAKRKKALNKIKKNLLGQVTRFDQWIDVKTDVFCVDIASSMRSVSYNAYYDPPDMKTKTLSGFDGTYMDLDSIGFEMVDYIYEKAHEVFGYVAREKATGRLVVSFR